MVDRRQPQRRRILHELKIGKIAAVDSPCQEHARMTLMKRADDDVVEKDWSDAARAAALAARQGHGGGSATTLANDSSRASDKGKTVSPFVQNFFSDHADSTDQKKTLRGLSDEKLRSIADLLSREHPKFSTSDSHSNKLYDLIAGEAKRRSLSLSKSFDIEKKYKTIADLPAAVRDALPDTAQKQFLAVFNSVMDGGGDDTAAFKQAWGAIQNAGWHKDKEGKWIKKADEGEDEPMTLLRKDYGDAPYSASVINQEVQAVDFDTVLAEQESREAAQEIGDEMREKWCALQRSFLTIANDDSMAAADKITAMQASLQQYVDSLAEQSADIAESMTKSLNAVPALAELLVKKEGEDPMTPTEKAQFDALEKTVADLTKKLADASATDTTKLTADLEKAKADAAKVAADLGKAKADNAEAIVKAGMSDAEKAHMDSLSGKDKTDFMSSTPADRKKSMAKALDADPVIFKSESTGEEFRKSDDPRLVKMAKAADEDRKIAKEERTKRENAEFAKRADDDLKLFSDEIAKRDVKIEVIRAIDKMDDGPKTALLKMLEVGSKAITAAFTTIGHRGEDVAKSAQAFEKHVSDIMSRDKVSKSMAMSKARTEHPDAFKAYQDAGSAN